MFKVVTFVGTPSATSSPVSEAGRSPSVLRTGPMIVQFGRAPAPVSPSPVPEKVEDLSTTGASSALAATTPVTPATCGPSSDGLSPSAALQRSLASRLQSALAETGSPLYVLTWKTQATPSGPPICQRQASARRISANDSTGSGWPTPTSSLADKGVRTPEGSLREVSRNHGPDLGAVAALAGWPTPISNDATGSGYCNGPNGQRYLKLPGAAALTGWLTPRARGDAGGSRWEVGNYRNLEDQARGAAALSGWATPTASEKVRSPDFRQGRQPTMREALEVPALIGESAIGSPALTGSNGRLNPELPRWLMGYPAAWGLAAEDASPAGQPPSCALAS